MSSRLAAAWGLHAASYCVTHFLFLPGCCTGGRIVAQPNRRSNHESDATLRAQLHQRASALASRKSPRLCNHVRARFHDIPFALASQKSPRKARYNRNRTSYVVHRTWADPVCHRRTSYIIHRRCQAPPPRLPPSYIGAARRLAIQKYGRRCCSNIFLSTAFQ